MSTSVMRLFVWVVLAIFVVVGPPGTLKPLSAEAEEVTAGEAACASEITPFCLRIRRLFAPIRQSHGLWALRASDSRLRAFHETHFSISSRGHMLPNGLNAPLLI